MIYKFEVEVDFIESGPGREVLVTILGENGDTLAGVGDTVGDVMDELLENEGDKLGM